MNLKELKKFLSTFKPISKVGNLNEEFGDLEVIFDFDKHDKSLFYEILIYVNKTTNISNCSIYFNKEEFKSNLVRFTSQGFQLNTDKFEKLDRTVDFPFIDYEAKISSLIKEDQERKAIKEFAEFAFKIHNKTSFSIDFSLIIDKKKISKMIMEEKSKNISISKDKININFWYDLENFKKWINNNDFDYYVDKIFKPHQIPVVTYYLFENKINSSDLFNFYKIDDFLDLNSSKFENYKKCISLTQENTTFQNNSPVISPALFIDGEKLLKYFSESVLFSIYSVFSDIVYKENDNVYKFVIKQRGDKIANKIDIKKDSKEKNTSDLVNLMELYKKFSVRENRKTFVNFWRQSIAQTCNNISDLYEETDNVIEKYKFIETETVEGNFKELSDSIRDTHTFMRDITAQVADTTTNLSNEIQRLVFTLLGAILANLFLLIRWSNLNLVIPFSLFVISTILFFYFPLIDKRIDELEELKLKGERDYDVYNETISGFSSNVFNFRKLESRKDDYIEYANERIKWARKNILTIHLALQIFGLLIVGLALHNYSFGSIQTILAFVFVITILYLSLRIIFYSNQHSYYKLTLKSKKIKNFIPLLVFLVAIVLILIKITNSLVF